MNQYDSKNSELVSALADGQLRGHEFAHAVTLTVTDLQSRADWHAFHVVGDALRSPELADCAGDAAFMRRFQERLSREVAESSNGQASALDAPVFIAKNSNSIWGNDSKSSEVPGANDSSYRWKILASVASLAAVASIGWSSFGVQGLADDARQLAQRSSSPASSVPAVVAASDQQGVAQVVAAPEPVMIRDPHLDALMAAHKQFGGTSALQMPAGFLRNATFENNAR